jgi:hypothetical protein
VREQGLSMVLSTDDGGEGIAAVEHLV